MGWTRILADFYDEAGIHLSIGPFEPYGVLTTTELPPTDEFVCALQKVGWPITSVPVQLRC